MRHYAVNTLVLCLVALLWTSGTNAQKAKPPPTVSVDLRTASKSPTLMAGAEWVTALWPVRPIECKCNRRGVIKLTFDPSKDQVRAQITLTFESSSGFTFHLADNQNNKGYGAKYNSRDRAAEVHSVNNKIYFFGSEDQSNKSPNALYEGDNYVAIRPYTTVTLNVQNQLATANNDLSYLYFKSPGLFSLDGRSKDVYLGLNRIVGNPKRIGSGLCSFSIQWFKTPL